MVIILIIHKKLAIWNFRSPDRFQYVFETSSSGICVPLQPNGHHWTVLLSSSSSSSLSSVCRCINITLSDRKAHQELLGIN